MTSSIYLTPAADLDALITALTGVTLTGTYELIDGPTATTGGDPTSKNTKITLEMTDTSIYKGTQILYYDRLDLAALADFSYYQTRGWVVGESILSQLTALRDLTGINFTSSDLTDQEVTSPSTGVASIPLTAASGSLGFINSVVLAAITVIPLSSVFSTGTLAGF